ncbi:F-ATPase gamma subunit [uncultured Roseburia sp.]|uniref:ATP synthase gamma chain n=1 Tax=Brotonthovivens ammoniilytica TaxID=2981725 RepID=A0ABT2TN10_9FIRM|nr:ATP synthase F1 subunit gamma [Brotonthovivens ammoniilytica]MCU6763609.1 ATP synthase F1 subunit gamma [Brotonthovivens ammoniilytica]SCJ26790.1 F-ATPase gamma subunit [uncultured Roseburia sp.]
MANAREIQTRMRSIQDTMKITNAMYMISSSKLKKARKMLEDTEPYFYTLQQAIRRIIRHVPDLDHPYFYHEKHGTKEEHKKKIGYIVITADKGMAGAYNHNVIKLAQQKLSGEAENMLMVMGQIGRQYFEKHGINIDENFRYTVQDPTIGRARIITSRLLEMYHHYELDEIQMIYTKMESAVSAEADIIQLLPLKVEKFQNLPVDYAHEVVEFVPSEHAVLDNIVPDYITGLIYGALVESYSSEHQSRMMAMEAATDSAKDMLRELDIAYNRARQAAITQEITEVIGGARAQKAKKKH